MQEQGAKIRSRLLCELFYVENGEENCFRISGLEDNYSDLYLYSYT